MKLTKKYYIDDEFSVKILWCFVLWQCEYSACVCVTVCRRELEQLALEKQHLEETVKNLRARCSDMEEQCVQHGRMHQRMKDRWAQHTQPHTLSLS